MNYLYFKIYYYTPGKFLIPDNAGEISLETKWQQLTSGLQHLSKYSGWAQQCGNLNGLDTLSDFQQILSPFQAFGNCFKYSKYNWYHCHSHVRQFFFFLVPWQCLSIFLSFLFHLFLLRGPLEQKNPQADKFSFLSYLALSLVFWLGLGDLFASKHSRQFHASHFLWRILVYA